MFAGTAHDGRTPEQQLDAAVRIERECPAAAIGSGVTVAAGRVITARHVIACPYPRVGAVAYVVDSAGMRYPASLLWQDAARDLAELAVDVPAARPAAYAHPPDPGSIVCRVSAAPQLERVCGTVVGRAPYPTTVNPGTRDIQHDIATAPGNSGSGLYDDAGHLVGIITDALTCRAATACAPAPAGLASSVLGWLP